MWWNKPYGFRGLVTFFLCTSVYPGFVFCFQRRWLTCSCSLYYWEIHIFFSDYFFYVFLNSPIAFSFFLFNTLFPSLFFHNYYTIDMYLLAALCDWLTVIMLFSFSFPSVGWARWYSSRLAPFILGYSLSLFVHACPPRKPFLSVWCLALISLSSTFSWQMSKFCFVSHLLEQLMLQIPS